MGSSPIARTIDFVFILLYNKLLRRKENMDNSTDKATLIPEKGNLRIKPHENGEGYIVFNLETSGLHFITGDMYALLERMDGKATIRDLASQFAAERDLDEEQLLHDFIVGIEVLYERNIVKYV